MLLELHSYAKRPRFPVSFDMVGLDRSSHRLYFYDCLPNWSRLDDYRSRVSTWRKIKLLQFAIARFAMIVNRRSEDQEIHSLYVLTSDQLKGQTMSRIGNEHSACFTYSVYFEWELKSAFVQRFMVFR